MVNGAGELLFFRHRESAWMPTLRLLHKFPFFLPMEQVDKGAIRFVLSGANIMCPGLTSPGAKMTSVPKGTVVVSFFNNPIINGPLNLATTSGTESPFCFEKGYVWLVETNRMAALCSNRHFWCLRLFFDVFVDQT